MDDVMKWMNNGLAVVLLVGGCLAAWFLLKMGIAGVKHLFAQVIEPLKDAGLAHLQTSNNMMRANEETNREISSRLQALNTDVKSIGSDVTEIKRNVSQWNETM